MSYPAPVEPEEKYPEDIPDDDMPSEAEIDHALYASHLYHQAQKAERKAEKANEMLNKFIETHRIHLPTYVSLTEEPSTCPECGGSGTVYTEAYQRGGEIADATERVCSCKVEAEQELQANTELDR